MSKADDHANNGLDVVLVTSKSGVYHLPDPAEPEKPQCKKRPQGGTYYRKEPASVPWKRPCGHCFPGGDADE